MRISNQRWLPSTWRMRTSTLSVSLCCWSDGAVEDAGQDRPVVGVDPAGRVAGEQRLLAEAEQAVGGGAGEGDLPVGVDHQHDVRRVLDEGPEPALAAAAQQVLGEHGALEGERHRGGQGLDALAQGGAAGRREVRISAPLEVVLRAERRDEHAGGDAAGRGGAEVDGRDVVDGAQRRGARGRATSGSGRWSMRDRRAHRGLGVLADGVEHPQRVAGRPGRSRPAGRGCRRPGGRRLAAWRGAWRGGSRRRRGRRWPRAGCAGARRPAPAPRTSRRKRASTTRAMSAEPMAMTLRSTSLPVRSIQTSMTGVTSRPPASRTMRLRVSTQHAVGRRLEELRRARVERGRAVERVDERRQQQRQPERAGRRRRRAWPRRR